MTMVDDDKTRWRQLVDDERGAALTEFAITLPIWLLVLTALMQLGSLGQATVAVKTHAYGNMWDDAYEKTDATVDENWEVYTPRSELTNVVPDDMDAVGVGSALDSAVNSAGGHWGEAWLKTHMAPVLSANEVAYYDVTMDGDERLNNNVDLLNPVGLMTDVIGEDRNTRTAFAVADNLVDDNIGDHLDDIDGFSGIAGSLTGALTQGTGAVPSLFAGVRYGEGEGGAHTTVEFSNRFLPHSATYGASYGTSLSPSAGEDSAIPGVDASFGNFGREQHQYAFYYLTGQTVDNKRVLLDVLDQDLTGTPRTFEPVEPYYD